MLVSEHFLDGYRLPLYKVMENEYYDHPRRKLQIPDKQTANMFWQTEQPTTVAITTILPEFKKLHAQDIARFIPKREWFITEDGQHSHADSLHGLPHESRVGLYSHIIAQTEGLSAKQSTILLAASLIHDTQREDDRVDPNHGKRAALWFKQNPTVLEDRGIFLSQQDFTAVRVLCRYHEVPYETVPQPIRDRYGSLLQLFMVADALDRYRTPNKEWWPDSKYFSYNPGIQKLFEKLMPFAKYLTLHNEYERIHQDTDVKASLITTGRIVGMVETPLDQALRYIAPLSIRRSFPFSGV